MYLEGQKNYLHLPVPPNFFEFKTFISRYYNLLTFPERGTVNSIQIIDTVFKFFNLTGCEVISKLRKN